MEGDRHKYKISISDVTGGWTGVIYTKKKFKTEFVHLKL